MQRTIILKPESIVQYKSMIGLVLDKQDGLLTFSTGHKVYRIKEQDVTSPSLNDVNDKLERDQELTFLANSYNIVTTEYRDSVNTYLSYVSSYN
tara:strand:- start:1534 stop:1815 length:282 start_codon:yes stop_codon:yes gene_type:complete